MDVIVQIIGIGNWFLDDLCVHGEESTGITKLEEWVTTGKGACQTSRCSFHSSKTFIFKVPYLNFADSTNCHLWRHNNRFCIRPTNLQEEQG